jgi:CRISPR-associated protein Cas2
MLNGYRIMWLTVMFDLPVGTEKERKAANKFRHFLLDQGFEMAQFSVYMKHCVGKEQAEAVIRKIGENAPSTGRIHILGFTDKQYGRIVCFEGRKLVDPPENPSQLMLF